MNHLSADAPKEGDLHAVVTTFGHTFELRYGYYEDCDRDGLPDVLYPDLREKPCYSKEGFPLVTRMQDACSSFAADQKRHTDHICGECGYFCRGEDWFGVCQCPCNRRNE